MSHRNEKLVRLHVDLIGRNLINAIHFGASRIDALQHNVRGYDVVDLEAQHLEHTQLARRVLSEFNLLLGLVNQCLNGSLLVRVELKLLENDKLNK